VTYQGEPVPVETILFQPSQNETGVFVADYSFNEELPQVALTGFFLAVPERVLLLLAYAGLSICMAWTSECRGAIVFQSARDLPVAATVDVVVIGGMTAGVAAAESASQGGASIFLVAPRPYLGEDLCATLRLERPAGAAPLTRLGKRLFRDEVTTPAHVKARHFSVFRVVV
jgi:hypothetical protein